MKPPEQPEVAVVLYAAQCLARAIKRCEDNARFNMRFVATLARNAEFLGETIVGVSDDLELHRVEYMAAVLPVGTAKVLQKSDFSYKNGEKVRKNAQIFGWFKKKQYLCIRFPPERPR